MGPLRQEMNGSGEQKELREELSTQNNEAERKYTRFTYQ